MYNIDSKKKGRSFMNKVLNVLELFAGVGGFRIGLENASNSVLIQSGQTNGNLQENLKMHLKYITTSIQVVRI